MNVAKPMIQCCICGKVWTKDGRPNKNFSKNDRIFYGCIHCKEGDWKKHLEELKKYKLSGFTDKKGEWIFDTGYKKVKTKGLENPFYELPHSGYLEDTFDKEKITKWNVEHHLQTA